MLAEQADWQQLNPARGDSSPRAATLWGDRNGAGATGFLVQFVDGFSSPSHVHNVSYRGVVISGLVHNDDPSADVQWMPAGSFWTQPKGAVHITSARGSHVVAYIEIEQGPYLVHPVESAFHSNEVPVNVTASNIVWLDSESIVWMSPPAETARTGTGDVEVAFLWGDPEDARASGALVRLPGSFTGSIHALGARFRGVAVQGATAYRGPGQDAAVTLEPGSTFASTGSAEHQISCGASGGCVLYVRSEGKYHISTATE